MEEFLKDFAVWQRSSTHIPREVRVSMLATVRTHAKSMGIETDELFLLYGELFLDLVDLMEYVGRPL